MQMDLKDAMIAQRAETYRLSKAYDQASEIFEHIVEKYPDNAWVNAHLGATYRELMDYGKAEHYLTEATKKSDNYLWAYAQLGETYRLRAIASNRNQGDLEQAIKFFKIALDAQEPKDSYYAWALAHLGATYRLKMTCDIGLLKEHHIDETSKEDALNCLNRALELIPTYAWAWGMRATVYRLAQEYEDSYWDLEVETVIAPEIGVLQNSPSPVPFIETRRVNLHEHSLLSFYMTKIESGEKKDRHYGRAIGFAKQALILQPNDLIALLILTVIEANQKHEQPGGIQGEERDNLNKRVSKFFEDEESEFSTICKRVLRNLIQVGQVNINYLETICDHSEAGKEHKLAKLILNDVIEYPDKDVDPDPQLWVWKNYALTQTCSIVLFLLSDLGHVLPKNQDIGEPDPYRLLSQAINLYYTWERVYQTPVHSHEERLTAYEVMLNNLNLKSFYQGGQIQANTM